MLCQLTRAYCAVNAATDAVTFSADCAGATIIASRRQIMRMGSAASMSGRRLFMSGAAHVQTHDVSTAPIWGLCTRELKTGEA